MNARTILIAIVISAAAAVHPAQAQDRADAARGARVWAATCNRCHNARSPLERNDVDWAVIVNHMRTMANLTRSRARDVSAFLQTANGGRSDSVGASKPESTSSLGTFVQSPADSAAARSGKLSGGSMEQLRQFLRSDDAMNEDQQDD